MRRYLFALALPLVGCATGTPTLAPRDAYRVGVGLSNALGLSLDAAAKVERDKVTFAARAGMAACPAPPQGVACREQAVRTAMGNAQPAFDKIDAAAKIQARLAETLKTLEGCAADGERQPDKACEVGLLTAALEQVPLLVEAVKAAKREVEATSPTKPGGEP